MLRLGLAVAITIINRQRSIPISTPAIEHLIREILIIIQYSDFSVGVLLTTNKSIRVYNRTYRHKDMPTDILSFSYHPHATPGKRIKARDEDDKNLGDLVISLEYVKKDAALRGITLNERLKVLLVHGICHLLGYDHETDSDWRSMRAKEAYILKKINIAHYKLVQE